MVLFPKLYITATLDGISAWAFNVLPSLRPFVFFTKVLSGLGTVERFSKIFAKPFQRCFKTPAISGYVFLMSIISGYPVGAKMTSDLYATGKITRSEALRMTSFCSTSGPMFIVGAVGAMMFGSARLGYIILISHIVGAFINGLLYRKLKVEEFSSEIKPTQSKQELSSIVIDSALSVISVGTIIAIFFVIITSLSPILSLLPSFISAPFAGLIEITRGCIELSKAFNPFAATIIATFIISFGGLSTMLQSLTMLDKIKMPIWLFLLQKLTHAILATIVAIPLLIII